MRSKSQRSTGILLVYLMSLLLGFFVLSCQKSPEDMRAWLKDRRAVKKMQEYIESDQPIETKAEAVMVIIERSESSKLPDVLKNRPEEEVRQIVGILSPRLEALVKQESFKEQTRAKDGAYYLSRFPISDGDLEKLKGVMVSWVDGDNFWCPLDRVGSVEQKRLYDVLGTRSVGVYRNALERMFSQLEEVGPDPRVSTSIQQRMQSALTALDELKLEGASEMVAEVFVKHFEKAYPNLADIFGVPFMGNSSALLVPLAEKALFDPEYKNEYLNNFRNILLNQYYLQVQPAEGVKHCERLVSEDRSGFLRWMCVDLLSKKHGKASVEKIMGLLPNEHVALGLPEGHPLEEKFRKVSFFLYEVESYCRSLSFVLKNDVPLDIFRARLKNGREVERLISAMCLSYNGSEQDEVLLRSYGKDKLNIEVWGAGVRNFGEYALLAAEAFKKRHDQQKQQKDAQEKVEAGQSSGKSE